jgi:hypothetical protein
MPPTPVYQVLYGGSLLPGYVQDETRPISFKQVTSNPIGRDGGRTTNAGANVRSISLDFLILSRLGTAASGLDHLDDCMAQYREALAILTRNNGADLQIRDTDRYYVASVDSVVAPLTAGKSTSVVYSVKWTAQPWAYDVTLAESTFSGNGTVTTTGLGDSRRTYPTFTVAGTVNAFTAEDENGKLIEFDRDTFTGTITINCGSLVATTASGNNAVSTLLTPNYGMYYEPNVDGEFVITVTGWSGSGNVNVYLRPRYEL